MTVSVGQATEREGHAVQKAKTDWVYVEWSKANRIVRNLQQRIYRRAQQKDWQAVKGLTRLLLKSYSNLLVSVRQVTVLNDGRKTPGIDGQVVLKDEDRSKLVDELRQIKIWQAKPVRRIYIPKAKGGKRPLGIPTIKDRVLQCVVKNAYEPRFEAEFEAKSYGFRPGRSTWDAIEEVYKALNNSVLGRNQFILDADIKGAFDHISHDFILQKIGQMPGRMLVKQWLKAGYVEYGRLHETLEGTPQGGVISPLLANIALDGLQAHLGKGYRYMRYADDFVVMAKTREAIEEALPKVRAFLAERGLELNQEKTKIVHKRDGFDFLGFHVQDRKGKLLITPQREKMKALINRLRTWLKQNRQVSPETVVRVLNPILRGWANYYSTSVAKETFEDVEHEVWKVLWRWARRRHPKKPKRWVLQEYFTKVNRENYVFFAEIESRRGRKTKITIEQVARVPIMRHRKVKGKASPFDPTLRQYWEKRTQQKAMRQMVRREREIAEAQDWKCKCCRESLGNGLALEIHHRIPIRQGGTDEPGNLVWLHTACHRTLHKEERVTERRSARAV